MIVQIRLFGEFDFNKNIFAKAKMHLNVSVGNSSLAAGNHHCFASSHRYRRYITETKKLP